MKNDRQSAWRAERDRDQIAAAASVRRGAEGLFAGAPFRLAEPEEIGCAAVFGSPHSGRAYFDSFVDNARLPLRRLRASEDAFVDMLFSSAPQFGAPLLSAVAPRAYIDLNRCPTELDPSLVDGAPRRATSARVAAGLGVAPRVVAEGVPIYRRRLTMEEVERRLLTWHAPYHLRLVELLLAARRRYGWALLLDCHSMPSTSRAGPGRRADADVILGDRFGVSARAETVDAIEAAFVAGGFRVARNAPFAGGYITERYGRPAAGVQAVQIEVDRRLYLDEDRVEPSPRFSAIEARLEAVIASICAYAAAPQASAQAAE